MTDEPKYKYPFNHPGDEDHCFACGEAFNAAAARERGHLPFYTVLIGTRVKRCCPDCFPVYQDYWLG